MSEVQINRIKTSEDIQVDLAISHAKKVLQGYSRKK